MPELTPEQKKEVELIASLQDVVDETGATLMVSKAPNDPEEKKEWAHHMTRIQIAFWVDDGATCSHCKHQYSSVDDFQERNPRGGRGWGSHDRFDDWFVCSGCFSAYNEGGSGT